MKEVIWSEDQTVEKRSGGYAMSILSTQYSYGG